MATPFDTMPDCVERITPPELSAADGTWVFTCSLTKGTHQAFLDDDGEDPEAPKSPKEAPKKSEEEIEAEKDAARAWISRMEIEAPAWAESVLPARLAKFAGVVLTVQMQQVLDHASLGVDPNDHDAVRKILEKAFEDGTLEKAAPMKPFLRISGKALPCAEAEARLRAIGEAFSDAPRDLLEGVEGARSWPGFVVARDKAGKIVMRSGGSVRQPDMISAAAAAIALGSLRAAADSTGEPAVRVGIESGVLCGALPEEIREKLAEMGIRVPHLIGDEEAPADETPA